VAQFVGPIRRGTGERKCSHSGGDPEHTGQKDQRQ
jgi:hypothetical protein